MTDSTHLSKIEDRRIRMLGIPAFGILIPNFTGLFGVLGPSDVLYWLGYIYFILIAFCIWQGNRWLLFKQRENMNWFSNPFRKLTLLVAANVFYTAPLTVVLLLGWYQVSGMLPDWQIIRVVTLINVICVIFVTHAYETVFLIKERQGDLLAFEKLERARAESELEALKNQIDPHFMFNSLNTLSYLIEHDHKRALLFNDSLSDVYRYILMNKKRDLVTLKEEIDFANSYFTLIRIRFGLGVKLVINQANLDDKYMAPISLQLLLENAVKHNEFDEEQPLTIQVGISEDCLEVCNNIRLKKSENSSGIGLKNLQERYKLITGKEVMVLENDLEFRVRLPYLVI